MKFLKFTLILSLTVSSSLASANAGHIRLDAIRAYRPFGVVKDGADGVGNGKEFGRAGDGVGNGFIATNGRTYFVDFLSDDEKAGINLANEDQQLSLYWKSNRFLKQVTEVDRTYFDGVKEALKGRVKYFPVFIKLLNALDTITPVLSELRIIEPQNIVPLRPSEVLAKFEGNHLLISNRPEKVMEPEERFGLAMRMALGYLNSMNVLAKPLDASELAIAVRYFSGKSFENDDIDTVFNKLTSLSRKKNKVYRTANVISATVPMLTNLNLLLGLESEAASDKCKHIDVMTGAVVKKCGFW
jgi:hypothetical protein